MEVYRGWYRKSFSCKNAVWHRVHHVNSVLDGQQTASTVCGRRIPTTNCDFNINPDCKCMQCEKYPLVIVETGRRFVPVNITSIPTKAAAVTELKRLLKPQTYYLRIFGNEGVCITAKWESDTSISIYTNTEIITKTRTRRVMTFAQIQANLNRFKSDIECICNTTDTLALAEKRKRKLKGRLTNEESYVYFEKLLYVAEK